MKHVAVIDIGKTNAKLALVDLETLDEVAVLTRPNIPLEDPYPHFDVDGHWAFLLRGLKDFHRDHGVDGISITTHGACGVLLDKDGGLATPVLDYEHTGPDELSAEYDALRPDFAQTGSPRLQHGLNLGAQIHWLLETQSGLRDRLATLVTYPQYWGVRLTGVAACDVSSLGCHTDLWNPYQGTFSPLVERLGLSGKIAPARAASDILGTILPEIAAQTGLAPDTPVACGIHDSNASLLPHILGRKAPFSVVSTGTWVIAMGIGVNADLDPARDTLVNVAATGAPVPSARFMGGRAFDLLAGKAPPIPSDSEIAEILTQKTMLLPSVPEDSGPFAGRRAGWLGQEPESGTGARTAALSFYLALMTATCLRLIGHMGPVIVEGPFSRNRACLDMLSVATNAPVIAAGGATGTAQGAALLLAPERAGQADPTLPEVVKNARMSAYANAWFDAVAT
ncbi:FGGY-family carbohydrate kinase [Celeribacter arenosi]|uniref:FGGY-family carbohydrate kinase n=1 Tax=Celeribacter arenosi TaxID=792649 RepID=A0ABP7JVR7_9RHOB